jgi:hypothetical protein
MLEVCCTGKIAKTSPLLRKRNRGREGKEEVLTGLHHWEVIIVNARRALEAN